MLGNDVTGAATSAIQSTPSNVAQYQQFEKGVIVYNADLGAHFMTQQMFDYWLSLQGQTTPDGQDLYAALKGPTQDVASKTGYQEVTLYGGRIIVTTGGSIYLVYGDIETVYYADWASLGAPTANQAVVGGGTCQTFAQGAICTKSGLGTFEVLHGKVYDKWQGMGGPSGTLGYPTSNSRASNGVYSGHFENGAVFASDSLPAQTITDSYILKDYEDNRGGTSGWLGLPTGEGEAIQQAGQRGNLYVNFQYGMILDVVTRDSSNPPNITAHEIHVWGGMKFHLTDFAAHAGWDWGTSADTYGYLTVQTTQNGVTKTITNHQRLPSDGDQTTVKVNQDWDLQVVASNDLRVDVTLQSYDANTWPIPDDWCGTINHTFDIFGLWGERENPPPAGGYYHGVDSGDGQSVDAMFGIKTSYTCKDSDWRACNYWSMHNDTRSELDWSMYAEAFTDVDYDENHYIHFLDYLWWEVAVEDSASPGVCYGMGKESIEAELGNSMWGEPIFSTATGDQNTNQQLWRQFFVQNATQYGLKQVLWTLSAFATGMTHDPLGNFSFGSALDVAGRHSLLMIYTDEFFGKGHVLRPYRWDTNNFKIFVADPNFQYPTDGTKPAEASVDISADPNGSWYSYPQDSQYCGGSWAGGRMYVTPYDVVDGSEQTPMSLLTPWQLLDDGGMFVLGSSAQVAQITDDQGKTFFKPGLTGLPAKWEDMQTDDARMPNLYPIPGVGGGGPSNGQVYAGLHLKGATHTYQIVGTTGQTYKAGVSTALVDSQFEVPGTADNPDQIKVRSMNTDQKAVAFKLPAGGQEKLIAWTVGGIDRKLWTRLGDLHMAPGQEIAIHTQNGGGVLVIENNGDATSAVTVDVTDGGKQTKTSGGPLAIPSGTTTVSVLPPVAKCTAWTIGAGDTCSYQQSIDGGSYDPSGQPVTPVQSPAGPYGLGKTTVTLTVANKLGLSSSCTATVNVVDRVRPHFTTLPPDVTSDPCTGAVGSIGQAAASDNCGGTVTIINDAPATFPKGVTTVTWTATDSSGNTATYQQKVTVVTDTTAPQFTVKPANVTSDPCTGAVGSIGSAQATDNCPGVVTIKNDAPATYPKGVTTVTWTATDSSGNSSTYQQTVTVVTDTTAPQFTVKPANVTSNPCTGAVGSIGSAQATDNCPGIVTIKNNAPATYPKGVTTVTWTATDSSGNSSTYQQTVTVVTDTTPPQFTSTPANIVANVCTGVSSIGTAVAKDNCGAVTVTNNAPASFPKGTTTTVTWTATDTAGNKATYLQTVRVDDATDLGSEHTISSVANNACLKVTKYPSWGTYMHSIVIQPQATGTGFPIPFTWTNCSSSGSGSLRGPWLQGTTQPVSASCQTLIKLGGNGAGPVSLTWWGNG